MKFYCLLLYLVTQTTFANDVFTNNFSKCGEYIIRGVVKEANAQYFLLFGEKSKSETRINFKSNLNLKLVSKLEKLIDIKVIISEKIDIKNYVIDSDHFLRSLPSEKTFTQDGIKLIKEKTCVK